MASPNTLALVREQRALRSNMQIQVADHNGNRETRRKAARDLVKRLKQGPIYGRNHKNEIVIMEKKRQSMSFHEALAKVSLYEQSTTHRERDARP